MGAAPRLRGMHVRVTREVGEWVDSLSRDGHASCWEDRGYCKQQRWRFLGLSAPRPSNAVWETTLECPQNSVRVWRS